MLNTISWQQYLITIVIFSGLWYAYVIIRYYPKKLTVWLKFKPANPNPIPDIAPMPQTVIGAIKADRDTLVLPAEELTFSGGATDDISDQTLPKGPGDELVEEAKVLINAFSDQDNKAEFLSLFKLLLDKYEVFEGEIDLSVVIAQLKALATDRLPFEIEASEWPLTFNSQLS